jgi:NAD+ kinase
VKVALFGNNFKGRAGQVFTEVSDYLTRHDIEIAIKHLSELPLTVTPAIAHAIASCDFIVCIGGDGSILHLVHSIGIPHPPLIGVNMGSLGFLADIPAHDVSSGFDAIFRGDYHILDRLVIEGAIADRFNHFAVNEIAVHRGEYPHLVDLAIHVDGHFVNTFSADGIILSTPCGSTAYSLAAGGPIVTPSLSAFVLTPICPHTVSNRPIVFLPKESIHVELRRGGACVDIAFDGQQPETLSMGETLEIKVCPNTFRLVTLASSDFFSTLRTKLGWTGSLRSM